MLVGNFQQISFSKLKMTRLRCLIMEEKREEWAQWVVRLERWKWRTRSLGSVHERSAPLFHWKSFAPLSETIKKCLQLVRNMHHCFRDLRDVSDVSIINYSRSSFWCLPFLFQLPTIRHVHLAAISVFRQVPQAALTSLSCSVERLGKRIRKQQALSPFPNN